MRDCGRQPAQVLTGAVAAGCSRVAEMDLDVDFDGGDYLPDIVETALVEIGEQALLDQAQNGAATSPHPACPRPAAATVPLVGSLGVRGDRHRAGMPAAQQNTTD